MIQCDVCPHFCQLEPGQVGKCKVREHLGDRIGVKQHRISMLAIEPIEKRPFFHFFPGSRWLSVGFYGCSFVCGFCQNYSVSQVSSGSYKVLSPKELWDIVTEKHAEGIVFTYNEPTVHHEYLDEVGEHMLMHMPLAPMKSIAVKTNGFVNTPILRRMATYVDAFNVDIKGDESAYKSTCDGSLGPVKSSIEFLASSGCHLEISYLVLPETVDNRHFHKEMRDWLAGLDDRIPVHLLYCYPFYKLGTSYPLEKLIGVLDLFREKLHHTYISNSFDPSIIGYRNTVCRSCGDTMISRDPLVVAHKTTCCERRIFGSFSEQILKGS